MAIPESYSPQFRHTLSLLQSEIGFQNVNEIDANQSTQWRGGFVA